MPDEESTIPPVPEIEDDYLIIRKSWLITAISTLVAFMVGIGVGHAGFSYGYARGSNEAALNAQIAVLRANQQAAVAPTALPVCVDHVSTDDDPSIGPEDAPVTIVEFSDFECPYCARFQQQTFEALVEKYGDQIRIVYRDYPINSHPNAEKAAEAAECADEQGQFWAMHDAMFQSQAISGVALPAITAMAGDLGLDMNQFNECIESGKYADEVAKDMQEAVSYGVNGTPTFFINGLRVVGAMPLEEFSAVIDQELGRE